MNQNKDTTAMVVRSIFNCSICSLKNGESGQRCSVGESLQSLNILYELKAKIKEHACDAKRTLIRTFLPVGVAFCFNERWAR